MSTVYLYAINWARRTRAIQETSRTVKIRLPHNNEVIERSVPTLTPTAAFDEVLRDAPSMPAPAAFVEIVLSEGEPPHCTLPDGRELRIPRSDQLEQIHEVETFWLNAFEADEAEVWLIVPQG
jgi:hypothetical protein